MATVVISETGQNQIIRAVEQRGDELVALTRQLLGARTDSQSADNPEFAGEAMRCQDLVAGRIEALGMSVQRWIELPHYPVVAGCLPGAGSGKSLAINGHIDVVPVGDASAWNHDPWSGEVVDQRLWGRGAADMKGGVASAIMAVQALQDAEITLKGDLWLHIVADEEVVGWSTRRLIERLPRVDAVIVAEPTDLAIMPVEGGLVHLRIEVDGRESHAGNRYLSVHAGGRGNDAGINAIEKMVKILVALQELERQWANLRQHPMLPAGFNTILPGVIMGGPGGGSEGQLNLISNPGTSPNYCSLEYNIWFLPGETLDQIKHEIETFILDVCRADPWLSEHPPRFTWKLRNVYFPPVDTSPDHPFIAMLGESLAAISTTPVIQAFTAASELAWYAEQGIHGAIFGPGRITQAHSQDEYVEVEQLITACTVMALAAARWCG